MAPQQRKSKSSTSVKKAQPATKAAAPVAVEDTGEWPHWMKVLFLGVKIISFVSAVALSTLGVSRVISSYEGTYDVLESRFSIAFAWSMCKATIMYLTVLSLGWLTIYVVADVFASAANSPPVSIPFTVAMKGILPFVMGGMWIGHAIRFGLDLQELNMMWLRVWLVIVVATNGPTMTLYVRTWAKAEKHEAARKEKIAARSLAKAEAVQAAR